MATFKRFEEIESWKCARKLTNRIYQVSNQGNFARDFTLKDQVRRACVSIMSNIAEGYDRSGTREFVQFLATAKGSAAEVRCQLYIALDQGYIDEAEFVELGREAFRNSAFDRRINELPPTLGLQGKQVSRYAGRRSETTVK